MSKDYQFWELSFINNSEETNLTAFNEGQQAMIYIKPYQNFSFEEHSADLRQKDLPNILNFINKIVKRSLHDMEYKQIGRLPKFFNVSKDSQKIEHYSLFAWSGYTY